MIPDYHYTLRNIRPGGYIGAVPGAANGYGSFSDFSSQWTAATLPGDLLDYAETEFLLAEAVERGIAVGGTAQSHYNNAIMASITFWGGKVSDANLYLLNPSVDYTTATGNYKQKIGYQKWIALANRGWDAWTEIRRLGHPNLNVVNPPIGGVGSLPLRFYYPLTEQTSNPINWAAAVKAQTGGTSDDVKTKAFLDAIIISSSSVASSLSNPSAVQLPGYILSLPV